MFLAPKIFWGRTPKLSDLIGWFEPDFDHVAVSRRSDEGPRRCGCLKKHLRQNISPSGTAVPGGLNIDVHIDPPKWTFFGRLYFSPYGVMCPQIFIHARDCKRLANAHPNWDVTPPPQKKIKFGLKFSVCAPIISGLVRIFSPNFSRPRDELWSTNETVIAIIVIDPPELLTQVHTARGSFWSDLSAAIAARGISITQFDFPLGFAAPGDLTSDHMRKVFTVHNCDCVYVYIFYQSLVLIN